MDEKERKIKDGELIVSKEDILQMHKSLKYGGKPLASFILWALRINKLNAVNAQNYHLNRNDFISGITRDLGLHYEISAQDLKKIPREGSFILIGNHPFGGAEAIITLDFIKEIRPDFKFMANFMLNKIKAMESFFIPVNPFENMRHLRSSYSGLKLASAHIQNHSALGIFPAGEVSTYQKETGLISDKKWPKSIMKFIKAQNTIVIPVYFEGSNSKLFHFLGKIHPILRTIKLPSELSNKNGQLIKIKIGDAISLEKQNEFDNIEEYSRFLRESTYCF